MDTGYSLEDLLEAMDYIDEWQDRETEREGESERGKSVLVTRHDDDDDDDIRVYMCVCAYIYIDKNIESFEQKLGDVEKKLVRIPSHTWTNQDR